MTQADRVRSTPPLNTSVSLSRRHMLAGVAVTTALPTAAIAATTAEPDPIFAAIAASREAQNEADRLSAGVAELNKEARAKFGSGRQHYDDCCAYVADILGVDQDEYTAGAFDDAWDAHQAFAETEPTTLAGLLAMLIYAGEIAERGDREVFHEVDIFPTIATAAKTLSGRSA